ncbi:family 16 glycosylhydrolase [Microbulbifer echini]|uniref:Family 16 glycosylhydrolase n=1 Tax=Microbulbifer echini TaxID=1529067 RepID=A0ABV4NSU6_9GAMM|nr:family 16 glycosylhydrolase [uncultured Microbulbifer sp.]
MAEALSSGSANSAVSGAFHWHHESDEYTGQADYDQSKHLIENFEFSHDLTEDYHIFGMTWTPKWIAMWVDSEANKVIRIDSGDPTFDEFRQNHFLILNLAVGGIFPQIFTHEEITALMPAKMYVDYVRIYDNDASDYSTELTLAEESAKSDNPGLYGKEGDVTESLELGTDTELYIWNNMEGAVSTKDSDALTFNIGASDWFGMVFSMHYDLNLIYYQNGLLNLRINTTSIETIGIGIASTGSGNGTWVDLVHGDEECGLERDSEWHPTSIPVRDFSDEVDMSNVLQLFELLGAGGDISEIEIDNIYFSSNSHNDHSQHPRHKCHKEHKHPRGAPNTPLKSDN